MSFLVRCLLIVAAHRAAHPSLATVAHLVTAETTVPLPPTWTERAKCGLREYYFQNRKCPWDYDAAQAVTLPIGGFLRVQTKPESCWYDANRYALKYLPGGSDSGRAERLLVHVDHGRELSAHPQCHLSMELSVLRDHAGSSISDSSKAQITTKLSDFTKAAADEWAFVKPSIAVGPDDDLDSIDSFAKLSEKDSAHYGELEMGPDVDEAGKIKYTTPNGLPSYLHINDESNSIPDYCGHKYSKTVRWIQFRKPGKFAVAYTNVRVGHCVMGVSYNLEGLVHMLSIDRWILVTVE
jgi:hypothetical protein